LAVHALGQAISRDEIANSRGRDVRHRRRGVNQRVASVCVTPALRMSAWAPPNNRPARRDILIFLVFLGLCLPF
jgi:hypothetical protein